MHHPADDANPCPHLLKLSAHKGPGCYTPCTIFSIVQTHVKHPDASIQGGKKRQPKNEGSCRNTGMVKRLQAMFNAITASALGEKLCTDTRLSLAARDCVHVTEVCTLTERLSLKAGTSKESQPCDGHK